MSEVSINLSEFAKMLIKYFQRTEEKKPEFIITLTDAFIQRERRKNKNGEIIYFNPLRNLEEYEKIIEGIYHGRQNLPPACSSQLLNMADEARFKRFIENSSADAKMYLVEDLRSHGFNIINADDVPEFCKNIMVAIIRDGKYIEEVE